MRRWVGLGVLCGVAVSPIPAGAQVGPPAEMKRLEYLIGTSTVDRGIDGLKQRGIDDFSVTGKWLSGGWQLALEIQTTSHGRKQVSLDVITYNPGDKKYHRWQFAPGYTEPAAMTGRLVGESLIFEGEPTVSGSSGFGFRSVEKGMEIATIFPNSSAAHVDLKQGDVITHAEGKSVLTPEGLEARRGKPGEVRHFTVLRAGRSHEITVTLGAPSHTYLAFKPLPNHRYSQVSGFMVGDQPGQIGEMILHVRP